MNNTPIYTITVFNKLQTNCNVRCLGFYYDLNEAIKCLNENRTDLREDFYNNAIIEKYYQGISNEAANSRLFFQWNEEKQGFYKTEPPDELSDICCFAIG